MSDKDPYVYPGTEILINREGLLEAGRLSAFERELSSVRSIYIPAAFSITPEGYRALPPYIKGEMNLRFSLIHRENDLKGFGAELFSNRAAEHICEINAIHPFREGNGRTQRLFLKVPARQAGHDLRIDKLDAELWMRGSVESFRHQDYGPMTACICGGLTGRSRDRAEDRSKDKDRSRDMD